MLIYNNIIYYLTLIIFFMKNKFIYLVIILLVSIIWFWVNYLKSKGQIDRNTYLMVVKWVTKVNSLEESQILKVNEKRKLQANDVIRTIWIHSLSIIEWWDWSVTRLWWNTKIEINELDIQENLWEIKVSFNLLNWQSWSNIVSFLWEKSYFKEYFDDYEAASRWTKFDINLREKYINVSDHQVELTKITDNISIIVEENKPIDLVELEEIDIQVFKEEKEDKTWKEYNEKKDIVIEKELKNIAKKELLEVKKYEKINIAKVVLNENEKKKVYNELLEDYQKVNFVKPDDKELFKVKLEIKDKLVQLSDEKDKEKLLENTVYDLNDIIEQESNLSEKDTSYEKKTILEKVIKNNFNIKVDKDLIEKIQKAEKKVKEQKEQKKKILEEKKKQEKIEEVKIQRKKEIERQERIKEIKEKTKRRNTANNKKVEDVDSRVFDSAKEKPGNQETNIINREDKEAKKKEKERLEKIRKEKARQEWLKKQEEIEKTIQLAKEEAERIAKEEAERIAKEEAERIAKEEAERIAKEEAERIAKEEA